jgi:RNA polymerase sigma factor (sigma-70 family)
MEPWLSRLEAGDGHAAWDLFARRYRGLMLATIRRLVSDPDDVMDVFSDVCAALTADDFARLRRFSARSPSGARVSTWLVIVVRNLVVDGLRAAGGRRRAGIPPGLTGLHREIFTAFCVEGHSPSSAFEVVSARFDRRISYPEFLRQLRLVRQSHPCPGTLPSRRLEPLAEQPEIAVPVADPGEAAELGSRLAAALATQPAEVRLAVQLFVIDELRAAEVARVVGWPNAKAVYNRVHRALEAMRASLEREGIGRDDL